MKQQALEKEEPQHTAEVGPWQWEEMAGQPPRVKLWQ